MPDLPNLNLVSTPHILSTAILRSAATVGDTRLEAQNRFDQVAVGKTFQAVITTLMQDGKGVVQFAPVPPQVNGPQLQMELPPGSKVGDAILLKLTQPTPNISFQFDPHSANTKESIELSSGAKLLTQLLRTADPNNAQTNFIAGKQALLAVIPNDTKLLAQVLPGPLSQAVEFSGAFYESHLKAWAQGDRSLEQVRQEPQNQTLLKSSSEEAAQTPANQLLPAQLHAHENRHWIWRGDLLPGQTFEWQIKDDTPEQSEQKMRPEEKSWQTLVKFNLPHLGPVQAIIHLTGSKASFRLSAENILSREFLLQGKDQLQLSLESSGTEMQQFIVDKDVS